MRITGDGLPGLASLSRDWSAAHAPLVLCCVAVSSGALQEGAAERDKVQDEVCDMLLQYADELEREEQQQAAAMAAWEAEQARMAAEQAAYEAEQLRIAQEEAAARRWAEEAER